jgi:predicted NBD/HSP70 family sugar kinase
MVVNGELMRGRRNTAGEFGHVPLSIDGPRCSCGATGCWEAYVSNIATLSRYFGRDLSDPGPRDVETSSLLSKI